MDESVWRANRSNSPFTDEQETRRPARSPELSPLDYWFWSIVHSSYRARLPPHTLAELKETVEVFAESLDEDEVIDATCPHAGSRLHAPQGRTL